MRVKTFEELSKNYPVCIDTIDQTITIDDGGLNRVCPMRYLGQRVSYVNHKGDSYVYFFDGLIPERVVLMTDVSCWERVFLVDLEPHKGCNQCTCSARDLLVNMGCRCGATPGKV